MSLRARVLPVFALALAGHGCDQPYICTDPGNHCPDVNRHDAGVDAARRDVGRDAPFDAGFDADAPFGVSDPGWIHIAALPDECEIDVATYPDRVVPVGFWEATCGVGCQQWGNTGNLIYAGESVGVSMIFTIGETPEGASDPRRFIVLSELNSGRALFALRDRGNATIATGSPFCTVYDQGVGSEAVVASVNFYDYDATGRSIESAWMSVLRHELAESSTGVRTLVHRDPSQLTSNGMTPSATHVGMLFGFGLPALVGNDGTYVVPTRATGDTDTNTNLEMTGEAELFWEAWREPTVLVRSSNGAPPDVLRAVAGGDLRSFTSDGTDFVWLEARGRDEATRTYASVELWTATYDGTTLHAPRLIRTIPSHYDGTVGGGYYVHAEPNPSDPRDADFVFYRLSDGARALVDLPLPANEALWVSEDDSVLEALGQRYRIDPGALTFE